MSTRTSLARWLGWLVVAGVLIFIGLHVANAVRLDSRGLSEGSRALVDRAVDIRNRAMPEYQDLVLATLPPNPNNGPFYRFDDNLHAAKISGTSPGELDEGDEFELQIEFEGGNETGLVAAEGRSTIEERDGLLVVSHREGDYLVTDKPLKIPLAKISDVLIRARADRGNRFLLRWIAEGKESEFKDNKLSLDLIADGEFHTYIVDAKNAFGLGVEIDENISLLAITPSNVDGAVVEIDFVRVVSKLWKYKALRVGTDYETVDDEVRPVLHVVPDQQFSYSVDVPENDPELSFGVALLLDRPPIEVSISVKSGAETSGIYSSTGLNANHWRDEILDLGAWAGKTVELLFRIRGSDDNVALISNPIIRSASRRRFNVIMILEDALRADHLSTHGYTRETSPEKTRFMNERGIVFLNAHSQATKTRPSVPSMMTSLYPSATGVWGFADMLSDRYLTIAEIFRAQGFVTASFIQNSNAGLYAGLHQGFGSLRRSNTIGKTTNNLFGKRVLDWIDQNNSHNFFLYLHSIDPHGPYDPPPPYDRYYRDAPFDTVVGEQALPDGGAIDPEWAATPTGEARRLLYDGEIRHNDHVIGSFVQELQLRGVLEDTLLVLVSDHGEWLGENGRWEHSPPGKRPVIHVPFMLSYPGLFDVPRRVEENVQLIDVMPTILEIASVDDSDLLMHGDSLVGLIQGKNPDRWRKRVTVSEEPMVMAVENNPCACGSVFFGPWQLHGSLRGWPGRVQSTFIKSAVYRFREDGVKPLVSFLPDLYARYLRQKTLSDLISENILTARKITEGEQENVYKMDPATLEELRGLGYVN